MTESAVARPVEHFTFLFGQEHRGARDLLLDLVRAFEAGDQPRARTLLTRLSTLAGPHFRYEEESLYPELVRTLERREVEAIVALAIQPL